MPFIVKTKSEINKYKINLKKKNVMKISCRSVAPCLKKSDGRQWNYSAAH